LLKKESDFKIQMKFRFPSTTYTVCTGSGKKTTSDIKPSISSLLLANLCKSGVTVVPL